MKTIWLIMQHSMPPELGHYNRHYNFAKYLKRDGYNPICFAGSMLHNSNTQMIEGKEKILKYEKSPAPFYFIKTLNYHDNKLLRLLAMCQFHWNIWRLKDKFDKPDVVLGSSSYPLSACLAIWLGRHFKCKSIVEVRDLWPASIVAYVGLSDHNPIIKALYRLERYMYENADEIIFTMKGGRDYIVDKHWDCANGGKVNLDKVHYINNGIDLEWFNEQIELHHVEDADLSDEKKYCVVYTGSIRTANHLVYLVDVAKYFENTNIYILAWGTGNELEMLKKKCAEDNVTHLIFKGKTNKDNIPSILIQSDALIMHWIAKPLIEKYGYSPNKLFDYLAAEKPVISDVPSKYEMVEENGIGILIPNNDAEMAAKNIESFINDSVKFETCKSNAKEYLKEYEFSNLTKQLEELF